MHKCVLGTITFLKSNEKDVSVIDQISLHLNISLMVGVNQALVMPFGSVCRASALR